jgi:hypothetical protein
MAFGFLRFNLVKGPAVVKFTFNLQECTVFCKREIISKRNRISTKKQKQFVKRLLIFTFLVALKECWMNVQGMVVRDFPHLVFCNQSWIAFLLNFAQKNVPRYSDVQASQINVLDTFFFSWNIAKNLKPKLKINFDWSRITGWARRRKNRRIILLKDFLRPGRNKSTYSISAWTSTQLFFPAAAYTLTISYSSLMASRGSTVRKILEHSVANMREDGRNDAGRFLQVGLIVQRSLQSYGDDSLERFY